jgi:hypothetical protein
MNNINNLVILNKSKPQKEELNIKKPKIKDIKDEKIILKTPVRNYSWEDLKVLSSI